jgi:uncharacterized protein
VRTRTTTAQWASGPGATVLTAAEVLLAVGAVLLDLLLPTLVLLAMAAVSLLGRRERWATLGVTRPTGGLRLVLAMLAAAVLWTAATVALFLPVVEHLSGRRQDTSDFTAVEGDLGTLVVMLLLSWTLAAVGEEVAYRGYLLTRVRQLLGGSTAGLVLSVLVTSLVFGLAHTEQGVVGVALASIDGAFYAVLRMHFGTIWAPVLAHGFINSIGLTTFYLVGPVTGLW